MKTYYARTFVGMGIVFAVLVAASVLANSAASEAKARYVRLLQEDEVGRKKRDAERFKVEGLRRAMEPVRAFATAWKPLGKLPEKEAAEHVRSDIEVIAQRQLGLVTDNAITPQPDAYTFQAVAMRVQRVTLRASGKDLVALLTWLGKVEEKYPGALVERCEFSSNVGGNTGLTIRLVQPLQDGSSRRGSITPAIADSTLLPEAIAVVPWAQYLPNRVKSAVAVGFPRNALQPAVSADQRPIAVAGDEGDAVTTRLETVLEGRLRSVIRGATPMVVVDGRVFRVGDELVIGLNRDRPVPQAKTKLKEIGEDRLVFHISGASAERPLQCDVSYALPSLMKAR